MDAPKFAAAPGAPGEIPGEVPGPAGRALAVPRSRVRSDPAPPRRSVRSTGDRPRPRWRPPEGLAPAEVRAVIAAAADERDRLLLRVLWATAARISEALALRPRDVLRDSLVLPNRKNPSQPTKRVFLPGPEAGLTGELLLWAREHRLVDDEPLFFSRKRGPDGRRRALRRGQAWLLVRQASERAEVRVLALRASKHGRAGEPGPVHAHLFRHARVRQIVRQARSLPLAQRQAGWARLQPAYLSVGDDEARGLMRALTD